MGGKWIFGWSGFHSILPFLSYSEEQFYCMIKTVKDYGANLCLVEALTLFKNKTADCKTLYYKFSKNYYSKLMPKYKVYTGFSFNHQRSNKKSLSKKSKRLCKNMVSLIELFISSFVNSHSTSLTLVHIMVDKIVFYPRTVIYNLFTAPNKFKKGIGK